MPGRLDAAMLRRAMTLYLEALEDHRDELDSLNVFPVPDGDTGTNLLLTQRTVERALADPDAPAADAVARSSLLGARGNSGVILAQVLRALCTAVGGAGDGSTLAEGLRRASEDAYRAVAEPAEGTVLTVLRDAAGAAAAAGGAGGDAAAVAAAALRQARATLERTPEMVPALASAGVVDAGGLGIVLLLDAIGAAIRGAGLTVPVGPSGPVGARGFDVPASDQRFEVQFVLEGSGGTIPALRADLARIGDSLVVAGDDPTRTVHVHTNDPDAALAAGRRAGAISQAAVRSLEERIAACWDGSGARAGSDRRTTGLIAVAEGAGLIDAFRSLGADVVEGGFGRDPAVGEVRAAIDAAAAELGVIVLPNAPAAVAVAGLAADLARIRARVVPVTSMPAGLSAATAYNPNATLAANARAMTAAAAACAAGEVGEAVIAAATRAGDVEPGGWVAVRAGEVVAVAGDAPTAALALAEALRSDTPDPQIITVVLGRGAPDADADAAVRALRVAHPDLELQPVAGGQPRFRYLIGIE